MRREIIICDVCDADGETSKAIIEYTNDEGDTLYACKEHYKLVKELGLDYEVIDEDFETELSGDKK